jgi:Predicted membrane protein
MHINYIVKEYASMDRKVLSTKELFMKEALRLFAKDGFEGVSVAQIAQAVGCSAPALYKHFAGKQELFEAILERSNSGYEEHMQQLRVDFDENEAAVQMYADLSVDGEIALVTQLFKYPLHDEWASAFRKMIMLEQFRRPELAKIYNERYVLLQYRRYAVLFKKLIAMGRLKEGDPQTYAMMYISPMILLVEVCDRDASEEARACRLIAGHVRQFRRSYRIDEEKRKKDERVFCRGFAVGADGAACCVFCDDKNKKRGMKMIVSTDRIIAMSVSLALCVGLPVGLCIAMKRKGASMVSLLLGAATFLVSAMGLEQGLHYIVLQKTGNLLTENIVFRALYGGMAAAVFEEMGRVVTFKLFMKKAHE